MKSRTSILKIPLRNVNEANQHSFFLKIELTGVEDETKGHNKTQSVLEKGFYIQWSAMVPTKDGNVQTPGRKVAMP